jgi:membrane associated rhomboid family serine protease
MTDAARNPDDYCYRHPDRPSFVLCEKCGRTICLECQTHVSGMVLCPDDARRSNVTMLPVNQRPKKPPRVRRQSRLLSRISETTPIATYSILVMLVVLFLVDAFTRGLVSLHLGVYPSGASAAIGVDVLHQPWSLVTSMLLAGGILGLLFNGYSIFILGRQLERVFGRQKFLVLYGISGLGASVLAFLLDGYVTSAIGAVFGLVGATVIMARRMGGNPILLYVTCAISLVFAIIFGSWQAAIGGGAAGVLTALTYLFEDDAARHRRTRLLLIGLVAVLIIIAVIRAIAFGG